VAAAKGVTTICGDVWVVHVNHYIKRDERVNRFRNELTQTPTHHRVVDTTGTNMNNSSTSNNQTTFLGTQRMKNKNFTSSSTLENGEYDTVTGTLVLTFKNGRKYSYSVPEDVVDSLYSAPSAGSYFSHYMRHSYNGTPVS
jgi:hypothetical protein